MLLLCTEFPTPDNHKQFEHYSSRLKPKVELQNLEHEVNHLNF